MTRFIMPIILIAISVSLFFLYTDGIYNDISTQKTEIASYNQALDNSKALASERDKLTQKYNNINPADLDKLQKLLPDNVDNIRLILEIEQVAAPYGMTLENIKYDTTDTSTSAQSTTTMAATQGAPSQGAPKDYGTFNLEFTASGSYNNFINFSKDLESNLRIVDISSISFSSPDTSSSGTVGASVSNKANSSQIYKYDFKISTYWLKN